MALCRIRVGFLTQGLDLVVQYYYEPADPGGPEIGPATEEYYEIEKVWEAGDPEQEDLWAEATDLEAQLIIEAFEEKNED